MTRTRSFGPAQKGLSSTDPSVSKPSALGHDPFLVEDLLQLRDASGFLVAHDRKPRTLCACQPVAFEIGDECPLGRRSSLRTCSVFVVGVVAVFVVLGAAAGR